MRNCLHGNNNGEYRGRRLDGISNYCNVRYKRVCNISECAISDATRHPSFQHHFSSPSKMPSTSDESRVVLALQALQDDESLSVLATAKAYNVNRMTLTRRRAGRLSRRDTTPKSRRLTDSEENAIVQYIVELVARSFPPRLRGVEDMANQLLRVRDAPPVGKLWAHNFVTRKEELRTRWTRRYDYQRAKCEDPKVIGEWFALVRNVKAKYGIVDSDIYNFDETRFMISIIFVGIVVTTSDSRSKAKLA